MTISDSTFMEFLIEVVQGGEIHWVWLVGWFTVPQDKLADKAQQQLSLQCDVVRRGPQRRVSSAARQLLCSAPLAPTTSCEAK